MKKILTILAVLAVSSQAHAAGLTLGGYSLQRQSSSDLYYGSQQRPVVAQQGAQGYGQGYGQQQGITAPESSGTHSSNDLHQMNF